MSTVHAGHRLDRTVFVTGSSSGIGRACCERLSRDGWRVYGGSRTVVATDSWPHIALDVRQDRSVASALNTVLDNAGQIDALVHCAGISLAGSIEDVTIAEAHDLFETNYFGTLRMLQAVLPIMRKARAGRIIVIGSIGGRIGLPYLAQYSASKFALDGLMEALRMEVAPFGIQASIVHPGDTRTAIVQHEMRGTNTGVKSAYREDFKHAMAVFRLNVERGPLPDGVADAVASLLTRQRMPARRHVGAPLEVLAVGAKPLLPSHLFERMVRGSYGLK